ncbi:MAG: DMT family protein [Lentisphaeria bacterium]|nr:DMT family protein [Lentisphaeria bacterium]
MYLNPVIIKTVILLILSNCFMTYAWYGHLKNLHSKPLIIAVLVSWAIAFFEYLIQVPANRIGHDGHLTLAQLKIMQEVISLCVFAPFSVLFMGEPLRWNFLFAGICMVGAIFFIFKS